MLYFNSQADVDEIELKLAVAQRYPRITWTTKLQDAHFYIMRKYLIDFIIDSKDK